MKKIKCNVHYPWAGIEDDKYIIEVDDNTTAKEIDEVTEEVINDMVWNRISAGWEEID